MSFYKRENKCSSKHVVLDNFKCFGPGRTLVRLEGGLTTFIGANGTGKTAVCEALLRLFGITGQERTVRVGDFHVPVDEVYAPATRELTIEAVLAFPELNDVASDGDDLDSDGGDEDAAEEITDEEIADDEVGPVAGNQLSIRHRAVPEFFLRMAATEDGDLKVRIVLKAQWVDDGTVDGAITDTRMVVSTFAEEYGADEFVLLSPAERSRIQMVYVPASRDGAREVTAFLRSRLWRVAQWSSDLLDLLSKHAADVAARFAAEPVVAAVENALTARWQELHDAGTHSDPRLRLLDGELDQLVRSATASSGSWAGQALCRRQSSTSPTRSVPPATRSRGTSAPVTRWCSCSM
jgi:hypothetical protein